jgi:hypothetical protein
MPAVCAQATIYLCLMDIASGMDYLHSLGVLHGDVKGANVLLRTAAPSPYDGRGFVCKASTPVNRLWCTLSGLQPTACEGSWRCSVGQKEDHAVGRQNSASARGLQPYCL